MNEVFYLQVPSSQGHHYLDRLRELIVVTSATKEYTLIIHPTDPEYPFVLLQIDDRAESVLTPEEWASRLATMPAEFQRPLP